jgi:hypothetical protein
VAVSATSSRAEARVRALDPAWAVGALVAVSFLVRLAVCWARETPILFPDEYIYTAIGRSIAASGEPLIRGHGASFGAILGPLLESPAWLLHGVAAPYRVVQAEQALAMSLAAVPAYALARRLRLQKGFALAVAAVTLCVPDFLYAPYVVSEPFAYPLVLTAVLAGVAALERPSRRTQGLFLVASLACVGARLQFVVLPPALLAAALVMGARERRIRAALLEQKLVLGLCLLGAAALGAVGLGYYGSAVHDGAGHAAHFPASIAHNLLVLAYACGWVIVPGAVLGCWHALRRPRGRAELAFAALVVPLFLAMLGEAAVYGIQVHERYLFYVVPLAAIAFALYAQRGFPARLHHALAAAILVTAATLVPLTDLSLDGEGNSPVLVAVHWVRVHVSSAGVASMVPLALVLAATALVVGLSRLPRVAATVAFAFAACFGLAAWALAADFDQRNAVHVRHSFLPATASWVDAHRLGPATLVQAYGGRKTDALDQLFWNRSITRVALLPGAQPPDAFAAARLSVGPDGTLLRAGRPLGGPVVVDGWSSYLQLAGARHVASAPNYDLWVGSHPRLAIYAAGRYRDGWITPRSRIDVWEPTSGTLRLRVALPAQADPQTLNAKLPDGRQLTFHLRPSHPQVVSLPVCSGGPWHVLLAFGGSGFVDTRIVSARTGRPRFVPGPTACPTA